MCLTPLVAAGLALALPVAQAQSTAPDLCLENGGTALCSDPKATEWKYDNNMYYACGVRPPYYFTSAQESIDAIKERIGCEGYCAVTLTGVDEYVINTSFIRLGISGHETAFTHWQVTSCSTGQTFTYPWERDVIRDRAITCPVDYGPNDYTAPLNTYCYRSQTRFCPWCGNPIVLANGAKIQTETDYSGSGAFPLEIKRQYNSIMYHIPIGSQKRAFPFGDYWKSTYDRTLIYTSGSGYQLATLLRPDGDHKWFRLVGSLWAGREDETGRLLRLSDASDTTTGWQYTSAGNETESYDAQGRLLSITQANGLAQTLTYSDASTPASVAPDPGMLIGVTDAFGRQLGMVYNARGRVVQITDPDGGQYRYVYDDGIHNGTYDGMDNLLSVTYPDGKMRTYLYELGAQGTNPVNLLTGIVDENQSRFATYGYYTVNFVAANSSEHAGGVDKVIVDIGALPARAAYFDTLGVQRTYAFTQINGVWSNTAQTRSCLTCTTASEFTSYDANGNVASRTDFNGVTTQYTYDLTRNLELTRTEAAGRAEQRKTSTIWHAAYRLPRTVASPLKITTYTFNGDPGVSCAPAGASTSLICSKTVQATTDATGASGFGATADGTPRVWTYSYNLLGQVLTMDGPRSDVSDVMSYTYDAQGNVATITNAAGQVTSIPQYDASGRPLKMVDANGLETLLAYTPRGWLQSRSVGSAAAGYLTTSHTYDGVGQLTQVTLPDGSFLSYTYDPAHRLTQISDTLGNKIGYTLDAMGNRIAEQSIDPQGTLVKAHSRQVDALNRLYKDIGGTNPLTQVTTNGYDNNGNLTTVTDPLNRVTTQSYDALNRLTTVVDPFNGSAKPTRYAYNGQDQLTQVTDPKGLVTSYTYNGHGEMLTQVSPDTGTTTFTYDAAGNLKTKLNARGVTSTYSYDALNRVTSIAYPDETATYSYDTCGNGVGRLCSLTDKSGATAYTYDLFGRVTAKSQTVGTLTQSIAYTYNSAGQLAQVTTPSGRSVTYSYQNNQPVSVSVNGAKVLDQVVYEPFGPIGGWRWGNSTPENPNFHVRLYDKDYRATQLTSDKVGTGNLVKNYAWSDAGTLQSITDPASAGNSFAYGYDALDRLVNATPGGVSPVSLGYSYDAVGNRTSQTTGSSVTTYSYPSISSRLQSLAGAQAKAYQYDAVGNLVYDSITTWTYGGNNRPLQAGNASVTSQFSINVLGQRVKKSSALGATRFVYDEAGRLWGEYNDSGGLITETVWLNDQPVAVIK